MLVSGEGPALVLAYLPVVAPLGRDLELTR